MSTVAFAQPKQGQERIDSLVSLLPNSKEDTIKAIWLSEIGTEYNIIDPNKGLQYGNEALALSQQLNWKRGEMMSHLSIGLNYNQKNDYPKALEHMLKSVSIAEQLGDVYNAASTNVSLGVVYLRAKDTTKALASYNEALKSFDKLKDARGQAFVYNNLANIYDDQKQRDKAVEHYTRALDMFEKGNNQYGVAMVNVNLGTVFQAKEEYTKALTFFFKSLDEYNKLGATRGIAINYNNIGEVYMLIAADSSGMPVADSLDDRQSVLAKAEMYSLKGFELGKEIGSFDVMFNTANHLSTIKELQGDPTKALFYYRQSVAFRDSVYNEENRARFEELAKQREEDLQLKQIELQEAQLGKAKLRQQFMIGGLVGLLLVAGLIAFQYTRIRKEKDRSESLLLNILPSETAEELKQNGKSDARQYDNVTVLFTDFKDFTQLAANLSPTELVGEIDYYYKAFDAIIGKYNIEKIKTIGDAYMCAGGLPVADNTNAYRVVKAALEIRDFVEEEKKRRHETNKPHFDIRIGVNTGPVVAGIVGVKKFAYDIWGDTVNLASRMESSGEAGKVNISENTFALVKDRFACTFRGRISAKHKGDVEMYFVEREIKEPVVFNLSGV